MSNSQTEPEARVRRWRDLSLEVEVMDCFGVPPAVPEHHHATWQVGAVLEGALIVDVLGTRLVLQKGGVLALTPSTPHAVLPAGGKVVRYLQFEACSAHRQEGTAPCFACLDSRLTEVMEALVHASRGQAPSEERTRLWHELWASVEAAFSRPRNEAEFRAGPEQAILTYLEKVDNRPVTVSELVEVSGLSRTTLLRRFREVLGTTPSRYHLHRRMHRVIERIDGGQSIAEAAVAHGFYDQSHFGRHARPVLAMSPDRWRKRRRVN